jgi:hypothetical protein
MPGTAVFYPYFAISVALEQFIDEISDGDVAVARELKAAD